MIIPTSYTTALLLVIATILCWGSWVSTFRLTTKWRFELYYYDFAFGVLLMMTAATLTLGTLGADITSLDNLTIVRRKQLAYAFGAGAVFNLANMLFMGSISITGMAVAFPIALGLGLIGSVGWAYYLKPEGSPAVLFAGALVVLIAVVFAALAYARHIDFRNKQAAHAAAAATDVRRKVPVKRKPTKGILTCVISGLLLASVLPLTEYARTGGEIEMGPYPIALLFGLAVFGTTILFNFYFVNLPVQGDAISMFQYLRGSVKQHLAGLAGGVVWGLGAVCCLVAAGIPTESGFRPEAAYTMGLGGCLIGVLWALLYWKEFSASSRLRIMIWATVGALAVGLAMVATTMFAVRK